MYRSIVIFALMAFAPSTQADIITCNFTEPFFSIEIDTDAKTLKKTEPDWENQEGGIKTTLISAKLKVKKLKPLIQSDVAEFARYLVLGGTKSLTLTLNYQGSDGMSDFAYPYETSYEGHAGGCASDKLSRLTFYFENAQK